MNMFVCLFFPPLKHSYEAYVLYVFFRLMIELAGGEETLTQLLEEKPQMKYPMPFCFAHIKPGR